MKALALVLGAFALVAAVVAVGCGEPRSGAVAETGACAQVLPLAQAHLPRKAKLVSVNALKRGDARRLLRELGAPRPSAADVRRHRAARRRAAAAATTTVPSESPRSLPRTACLLVYQGSFKPAGAVGGPGPGRYLILVLGVRHPRLLRGVVANTIPPAVKRVR